MIDHKFEWTYQQLPASVRCGDLVDVRISHVDAPDSFFVQ
jgi:hypothetical protein